MNLLRKAGQDLVADSKQTWSKFFDKEGNVHSVRFGTKTREANYIDFYHAMGRFLGKKTQEKFRKKVEVAATVEAIIGYSMAFGVLVGLISMLLAFITKGQGWPQWIVTFAVIVGLGPMFAFMFFIWFVESWMTTHLANAFYKELAQKKSGLLTQKPRRRHHWSLMVLLAFLLFVGLVTNDWPGTLFYPAWIIGSLVFGFLEGILLLLIWRLLSRLFSKKSSQAVPQALPPKRIRQMKNRFERIYMAFKKGDYAAAYGLFEHSQITETEFQQEIQDYLTEHKLNRLRLPDFREKEPDLDISFSS